MQNELTIDQLSEMQGSPVYASDGDQIGKVEEIFVDDQTGQPAWIGLGTGFLGTKRVLVPVQTASVSSDGISVPYDKDHVKGSPDIDDDHIPRETEQELYRYYTLSQPGGGESADMSAEDASVVRSEEELDVGTRDAEIGRVRLRKWVETEPVEMDVELRRETAQVRTEQIDQPVSDVELGDQQVDVALRGEEAVVGKRTVAKERVSVDKGVETEHAKVSDEVRKEHVEVEGDDVRS